MKTSRGSALLIVLLVVALALAIGVGYFAFTPRSNEPVATAVQMALESEEPVVAEPVDGLPVARLKSLIPNDIFCLIANGDDPTTSDNITASSSQVYFEKYSLWINRERVIPVVACRLDVSESGEFVYALFERTRAGQVSVEIYDERGEFKQVLVSTYPVSLGTLNIIGDVNFDGYQDVALTENVGASNAVQSYLVFDPASSTFLSRPDLHELSNPWFDATAKKITTYMHGSAATGTSMELSFINGKYVISKIVDTQFVDTSRDDVAWRTFTVTKELKDGFLATTSVIYNDLP